MKNDPFLLHPRTFLVVDDDPDYQRLLYSLLMNEGYNVLLAGSGSEALEILERHRKNIDGVITDLCMPQMDGVEFIQRTHKLDSFDEMPPTLVVTGNKDAVKLEDLDDLGIRNILFKPINKAMLSTAVESFLSEAHVP